jgi:uncharacterized protein (DUF1697 family)
VHSSGAARGSTAVYVALLRGINVGGNNMVSMKALKESFETLGFADVQTYINSGNVLFRAKETDVRELEDRIDRMLAREHALKGKTVVRSEEEMTRLVKTIDAEWTPDPDWRYNVVFLRYTLDPNAVVKGIALDPDVERVVCCPGTLLWSARVSSITRSAMLKLSSRPVYQEMTVRNVNTTRKILELMDRMQPRADTRHAEKRTRLTRAAAARAPRKATRR